MSDVVIRVENLSKRYTIRHASNGARAGNGLRHALQDTAAQPLRALHRKFSRQIPSVDDQPPSTEEFYALRDVSFEVKRGEVLGVVGRNGAGKSTLLKILSRITEPASGRVGIKGRVASLLEVGTGFHPELTGRENIFLNGAILGMTRAEVKARCDEIVDFAGVGKFLDTPVKRYSSGMHVRLAFAVAAHLEPEILIVDEVLAVGDAEFQKRCLARMNKVSSDGRTVIFVSHNLAAVQSLCSKAILLSKGSMTYLGAVGRCLAAYLESRSISARRIIDYGVQFDPDIEVHEITANDDPGDSLELNADASIIDLRVRGRANRIARIDIEAHLYDSGKNLIGQYSPARLHGNLRTVYGDFELQSRLEVPALNRGTYELRLLLTDPTVQGYWDFPESLHLTVAGRPLANGDVLSQGSSGALLIEGQTFYAN